MWEFTQHALPDSRGVKLTVNEAGSALNYTDALDRWATSPDFCGQFNETLAALPYTAFRWETPCLTEADRLFECVVLDSPSLDRTPEPSAFVDYFGQADSSSIVSFPNLRGDAIMIVPRPAAPDEAYVHLASFVRRAPKAQCLELWQHVGSTMQHQRGRRPVWLSTAGAGVAWLHVRIDQRPKYYGYAPFRAGE